MAAPPRAALLSSQRKNATAAFTALAFIASGVGQPTMFNVGSRLQRTHDIDPVAATLLLDASQRREWKVIALHRQLLGHQHVVDLAACGGGLRRILVEEAVPVRIR